VICTFEIFVRASRGGTDLYGLVSGLVNNCKDRVEVHAGHGLQNSAHVAALVEEVVVSDRKCLVERAGIRHVLWELLDYVLLNILAPARGRHSAG
jgi:hypothetical protein